MSQEPTLRNLTNPNFGVPPKEQNNLIQQLGAPHTSSFNFMINHGLDLAVANINPVEFAVANGDRIKVKIQEAKLSSPLAPLGAIGNLNCKIYPKECKQSAATYKGKLNILIGWSINGKEQVPIEKDLGNIPIMIKSNRCHLHKMSPKELVEHGEHEQEWGGYFVIKGHERIIRMLLMTRRNYPVAVKRSGWKARGDLFSEFGIQMRCVAEDQSTTTNVLHFVTDGTVKLMFSQRKMLYYVPLILILKALGNYCDYYIFKELTAGYEEDNYYKDCIQKMLRAVHVENLHKHKECISYLGKMFRVKFWECPEWYTDEEIGRFVIKQCILIHLDNNEDKFHTLIFMTKKLFALAQNKCKVEGVDSVMMQELMLGGHVYLQLIKEKLQAWLFALRTNILRISKSNVNFTCGESNMNIAAKQLNTMEHAFEYFLATGNLQSYSGLGLMQEKGLTIVAENINRMRYMSHFKAVHRGAFFQEMRTTEVRQLLPDAWGFICPVHTPDGAPCGLLNHLTMDCIVTDAPDRKLIANISVVLVHLGMIPITNVEFMAPNLKTHYAILLDGKIIGYIADNDVESVVNQMRLLKIKGEQIPKTLEIALVSKKKVPAQYPGLFLFTGPARMMRPVINLFANDIELIGTFEQIYLEICITIGESYEGVTTHMEISKTSFMSNLAQLIPMPDCNQSPRNMYQCQMGKQTMGTPCHNYDSQADTKLYRLQTPSTPLFRPVHHDKICLDDFAMGTNAIVAVISYTGYDMEDAMIINKASEERGFAHASIYKSDFVDLEEASSYFCRNPAEPSLSELLDTDGLPYIGRKMVAGTAYYCYYNVDESAYKIIKFRSTEECYIHSVRLVGNMLTKRKGRVACITFRVPRNPIVGDKFASRAGQKGICSHKWPIEDLPFTETGLVPDIIFNPHGFPSRMTIAMMIEMMAGKSSAMHGLVHDATPFRFNEKQTAIDYFGKLLEFAGYNYYGTETMYSGIDGRELPVQIFFGIVHYQRLRHMVSDKYQVRSTGPIDILTKQPIQGRKRGGGVRFGEMERDALISHGASFLLQDRLLHGSDKTFCFICTTCKTFLGTFTLVTHVGDKLNQHEFEEICRLCGTGDNLVEIQIPYILKYFVMELASCNINLKLNYEHV